MPERNAQTTGALLGLSASMRTFMPPAALALRGGLSGRARTGMLALAAGELAWDKAPFALARTDLPAVAARIASGAIVAAVVAGPRAALAAGATAAAGTFACYEARKRVCAATGWPDPPVAVAEDLLAAGAAAAATRAL